MAMGEGRERGPAEASPKRTRRAPCKSPSGPAKAVSVCPHLGVLEIPLTGKTLGRGAGNGDMVSPSPSMMS